MEAGFHKGPCHTCLKKILTPLSGTSATSMNHQQRGRRLQGQDLPAAGTSAQPALPLPAPALQEGGAGPSAQPAWRGRETRLLHQQPPEIHLANVFMLSKTHRIACNGTNLRQVPIKRWVRRGASWFPSYLVQHYQLLLRGISVLARPQGMPCEHSRHLAVQTHSLLSVFR